MRRWYVRRRSFVHDRRHVAGAFALACAAALVRVVSRRTTRLTATVCSGRFPTYHPDMAPCCPGGALRRGANPSIPGAASR